MEIPLLFFDAFVFDTIFAALGFDLFLRVFQRSIPGGNGKIEGADKKLRLKSPIPGGNGKNGAVFRSPDLFLPNPRGQRQK